MTNLDTIFGVIVGISASIGLNKFPTNWRWWVIVVPIIISYLYMRWQWNEVLWQKLGLS